MVIILKKNFQKKISRSLGPGYLHNPNFFNSGFFMIQNVRDSLSIASNQTSFGYVQFFRIT